MGKLCNDLLDKNMQIWSQNFSKSSKRGLRTFTKVMGHNKSTSKMYYTQSFSWIFTSLRLKLKIIFKKCYIQSNQKGVTICYKTKLFLI